jgi:hypothetical protein
LIVMREDKSPESLLNDLFIAHRVFGDSALKPYVEGGGRGGEMGEEGGGRREERGGRREEGGGRREEGGGRREEREGGGRRYEE